jgi:hypothetical protein
MLTVISPKLSTTLILSIDLSEEKGRRGKGNGS